MRTRWHSGGGDEILCKGNNFRSAIVKVVGLVMVMVVMVVMVRVVVVVVVMVVVVLDFVVVKMFLFVVVVAVVLTIDGDGAVCMGSSGGCKYGGNGFKGVSSGSGVEGYDSFFMNDSSVCFSVGCCGWCWFW